MSEFREFKEAVQRQIKRMEAKDTYSVTVSGDALWETYLSSFPEGTNLMFKERTEYDCNCCKQFIKGIGGMVTIHGNKLETVWDINVPSFFQEVADALAALVRKKEIKGLYRYFQNTLGLDKNYSENNDVTFQHLFYKLPNKLVVAGDSLGSLNSTFNANKDVLERSVKEITLESIEIVLDLISQNSLYRGEEHKESLTKFRKVKTAYDKLKTKNNRQLFLWKTATELGGVSRFKNTVIGTLLYDISTGVDLESAVGKFENKVAPANYKRSSALITQSMIKKAEEEVTKLGIEGSLYRRYAKMEDITVNNVLFVNRSIAKKMGGVFDDVVATKTKKPNLKKVEEVSVDTFIADILPNADSMEIMVENKHVNNFTSLIAPDTVGSPNLFKWGNNFSWSYAGEVTDSVKERVKSAGGNVEGVLRCSLSWFNTDDLDIHVVEPSNFEISYRAKRSPLGGRLDVDMNCDQPYKTGAVENIIWATEEMLEEGEYKVYIDNYSKRNNHDVGFDLQVEFRGEICNFHYDKAVGNSKRVLAATIKYTKGGLTVVSDLENSCSSKEIWNIDTEKFHKVSTIMNSPNHWDGEETGNKHLFFFIDGCYNSEPTRGFYNEFLKGELTKHRKVFEVLSSKMKVPESENQLSGLGFSSTKRESILCRVSGKFNRLIKINF